MENNKQTFSLAESRKSYIIWIVALLIPIIIGIYGPTTKDISNKTERSKDSAAIYIGDNAYIAGGKILPIDDDPAMNKYNKILVSKDMYGLGEMRTDGEIFQLDKETQVLVIDQSGWGVDKEVRILDGQYTGRTGWIDSSFIYKK